MNEFISLESLLQSKAAMLICYPKFDPEKAEKRLQELRSLGVDGLVLTGRHRINDLSVLGKGHVGIVAGARIGRELVALKIRRTDADRESMAQEADNLRLANSVSVGPRLLGTSKNFLLMEFLHGEYLRDWLEKLGPSEAPLLKPLLRRLLDDARSLDKVGLDHGELSTAPRHILVSRNEPVIIDFESASVNRRAANVTSLAHFLFNSMPVRSLIGGLIRPPDAERLLEALRLYKITLSNDSYAELLKVCDLNTRTLLGAI